MSPRGNPQRIITFRGNPALYDRARKTAEEESVYVGDVHERWWTRGAETERAEQEKGGAVSETGIPTPDAVMGSVVRRLDERVPVTTSSDDEEVTGFLLCLIEELHAADITHVSLDDLGGVVAFFRDRADYTEMSVHDELGTLAKPEGWLYQANTRQPPAPSRSDAARRLVDEALAARKVGVSAVEVDPKALPNITKAAQPDETHAETVKRMLSYAARHMPAGWTIEQER